MKIESAVVYRTPQPQATKLEIQIFLERVTEREIEFRYPVFLAQCLSSTLLLQAAQNRKYKYFLERVTEREREFSYSALLAQCTMP